MLRFITLRRFAWEWTKMMIKRHLPLPGGHIPVGHWKNYCR
jgi:hypothetical protein